MTTTATEAKLDCGCISIEYTIEDKPRNLVAKIKHTIVTDKCTAGHKQRYGLASAWTRQMVVPEKPKADKAPKVIAPPQAAIV